MSITFQGIQGEGLAREIILNKIKPDMLTQVDWMAKIKGKWISFEVKNKQRFKAPPFDGHGLEIKQKNYRMELYNDTGIRCIFFIIETNTNNVFCQWLDVLENTKDGYFDTKNNIRIYKLDNFKKIV
jgi:penicillin-binding protein-related factor A (putative recombinase)